MLLGSPDTNLKSHTLLNIRCTGIFEHDYFRTSRLFEHLFEKDHFLMVDNVFLNTFLKKDNFVVFEHVL